MSVVQVDNERRWETAVTGNEGELVCQRAWL